MNAKTYQQIRIAQTVLANLRRQLTADETAPANLINDIALFQAKLPDTSGLIDRNNVKLIKGTVVHYQDGWMEVKSVKVGTQTVNLGPIFHSRITTKNVPVSEVYADHDKWYANWQESETYKSM